MARSHLPDVLLLGALEPSTSPIVPGQKDIRASRPAQNTTLTGGSRFNLALATIAEHRTDLGVTSDVEAVGWAFSYGAANANGDHSLILRPMMERVLQAAQYHTGKRVADRTGIAVDDLRAWLNSDRAMDGLAVRDRLAGYGAV